ncbi:MAG: hypothetical protein SPK45_01910 [Anaerovoracaceae bacterium]|nr:hypothetical protein [Anaerovoracaceae bacterium]
MYVKLLDEVYKKASCTAILDGAPELATQGANADELIIPKIDMDGLADYDRANGYLAGSVKLTNETVKCNFDRGRKFTVDAVDNIDTAGLAFGRLASEFLRTKVVPELDAFRIASYCKDATATVTSGTIADGTAAIKAIAAKYDAMTDAEVPEENRILLVSPTIMGLIRDLDTTKSKEIMGQFAAIQKVPSSRFYTAIDQLDGKSPGQEAGGFKKAEGGKALDFLIVEKSAIIQFQKRNVNKAIAPEDNQDADGWQFNFREVGIADTYENKLIGIAGQYHE